MAHALSTPHKHTLHLLTYLILTSTHSWQWVTRDPQILMHYHNCLLFSAICQWFIQYTVHCKGHKLNSSLLHKDTWTKTSLEAVTLQPLYQCNFFCFFFFFFFWYSAALAGHWLPSLRRCSPQQTALWCDCCHWSNTQSINVWYIAIRDTAHDHGLVSRLRRTGMTMSCLGKCSGGGFPLPSSQFVIRVYLLLGGSA